MFNFGRKEIKKTKKSYNDIIAEAEENLRRTERITLEQNSITNDVLNYADKIWATTMPTK